jgi:hypothetical protein
MQPDCFEVMQRSRFTSGTSQRCAGELRNKLYNVLFGASKTGSSRLTRIFQSWRSLQSNSTYSHTYRTCIRITMYRLDSESRRIVKHPLGSWA